MGSLSIPDTRKLFTPLRIGTLTLSHRIIMSPLTRKRCPAGIPGPLVAEYYAQRATPGGLLISEGMMVSVMAGNMHGIPGMYTPEHIRGWKVVTDTVHAKGAYMACQLWHCGRFAVSVQLGGRQPLSSSATNIGVVNAFTVKGRVPTETAKEMSGDDIKVTIEDHVHAAKCAVEAGFDVVEITAGNGYLCDQFLNSKVNLRTDDYGGSKENRARFTLELLDAIIAAIGPSKVALRFSPWGTVLMPLDADPISTFTYVLSEVEKRGIAYVCLTQPRTDLFLSEDVKRENLRKAVQEGSGYDGTNCFEEVEKGELDAITFGRWFISNPDLVEKIRLGMELTERTIETTYADGPEGYTDYPVGEAV
ncbi:FMN-linked oxidoreductase [Hyaloscypha variabilis F]|uniref:FMN-linked oxidoreductase n=1 Tax=Hyaloscypha variabilis (strain UAMH 11265 / GT02V1 / F) TaxID=1149755 RepID=A0A2J6R638_HYAVF|nr:FMN-linked oxidoreductase [Hyaloscypha variabilis F]